MVMSMLSFLENPDYLPMALLLLAVLLGLGWMWRSRQQTAMNRQIKARKESMEHLDTVLSWEPTRTRALTSPVLQAHRVLKMALPEHLFLAQISLSRFLKVPTRNSYTEWMRRVGGLCVDILVCDADAQVVAVVEIRPAVDSQNSKAIKRQQRMDRVLEAAGIPVHVWLEGQLPSPASARNAILGSNMVFTTRTGATLIDKVQASQESEEDTSSNPPVSEWFETSRAGGVHELAGRSSPRLVRTA